MHETQNRPFLYIYSIFLLILSRAATKGAPILTQFRPINILSRAREAGSPVKPAAVAPTTRSTNPFFAHSILLAMSPRVSNPNPLTGAPREGQGPSYILTYTDYTPYNQLVTICCVLTDLT